MSSRKTPTPREAAIKAYAAWSMRMQRIEPLAEQFLVKHDWSKPDRALFHELLYGVVRMGGRIRWILEQLSPRGITAAPVPFSAAAVGLYQLLYLDRVPDYAAVDTSVEIAKRFQGASNAGWVNAVLRRVASDLDEWRRAGPKGKNAVHYLSVLHSHPEWMIMRWLKTMGSETIEGFLEWNNRRPKVTIRVNTVKGDTSAILLSMKEAGIECEAASCPQGFYFTAHSTALGDAEPIRNGSVTVQDVSQGLVGLVVKPQPRESILDLCAAPGGKTTHLAELCPDCHIVATDKSAERLQIVKENVARIGCDNIEVMDYSDLIASRASFDAVLVDAPCSGTGVLARRPDLRWRRKPGDIKHMASVQLELLRYAVSRIKTGGRIIYSTCSVEPEENAGVVEQFIGDNRRFRPVGVGDLTKSDYIDDQGFLNLRGMEIKGDGVFAARLES